ncbi:MAG: nicotinate-nicotinamide nucleotide adenylyltransferase [bacterium]|nr:nicotinate-nicotinamide nucleotide adenylyltransferase [bacterium]
MSIRIAIGGSACNPPHRGHLEMVRAVRDLRAFDRVRWDVCGARRDKPGMAPAADRIAMAHLTFPPEWDAVNDRLAHGPIVPTIRVLEETARQYPPDTEIVWFTSVDLLIPQERHGGRSEVAACWVEGERLLTEWPCLVLPRRGYPHPRDVPLPLRAAVHDVEFPEISSTEIRRRIAAGEPFHDLVTPDVERYIAMYGLYGWGKK